MHRWGKEATARAMHAESDAVGTVSAAQYLARHVKSNDHSEAVPSVKYIQSDNLDHFSAGDSFLSTSTVCTRRLGSHVRCLGSLTTPNTMSWLVYLLSLPRNHHRQLRLREELQLAGIKPNSWTDLHVLNKLPYLDCLLRETLRRYPPIPGSLTRVAPAGGMTVDGHFVSSGVSTARPNNEERWLLKSKC